MENINRTNEIKSKFWQKVMVAFCLFTILFSLLSISSSFATSLILKSTVKLDTATAFNRAFNDERVRVVYPDGNKLFLSHNLGVNLGVEEATM